MKINKLILPMVFVIFLIGLVACQNSDEPSAKENNDDQFEGSNTHGNSEELEKEESIDSNENSHYNDNINGNKDELRIDETMEDPSIIALVNKQYHLTANDTPEDLVTVEVPTVLENPEVNQLRKEAADALKMMFDEAKKSDIYLYARSGYRSYATQEYLFQSYVDKHGKEAANRYSAKPGQSEHQTGLVMDVTSKSVDYQLTEGFAETKEGKWLQDHAYEYGFIIRYPKDAEHITGYIYEPWHIRYLGVEMATDVFNSKVTYEEFLESEGLIDVVTK